VIRTGVTVDSSFIIDVLRGTAEALAMSKDLDARGEAKFLTTPVLYEVSSGLMLTRSRSETNAFRALASRFAILPFDEASAVRAAEIRAELMRLGRPKAHVDVMIAGIASAHGHTLVTRDKDLIDISESVDLHIEVY